MSGNSGCSGDPLQIFEGQRKYYKKWRVASSFFAAAALIIDFLTTDYTDFTDFRI
jgi:hypothetical protein